MDLILVRHALAWERDATRWPDDRERPLRPIGARRMRSASRGLGRVVSSVDALWTSPYVRTVATAAILHEEVDWPEPRPVVALGEEEPATALLSAIARARNIETLALVGHAPQLDLLLALAVSGRRTAHVAQLKKGGAACVRFASTVRPGGGQLVWLAPPRWLRALDE